MFTLLTLLFAFITLHAQDGGNLAYNGDFRKAFHDRPHGWIMQQAPYATYQCYGGPDGLPYVSMHQGMDDAFENTLRIRFIALVPGEKYHLSAMIRTKNFSAKRGELLLVQNPWYKETGVKKFPETTNGWQRIEAVVTCPEYASPDGFDIVVLSIGQRGVLDIADIRLVALTKKGAAGSRPSCDYWFGGPNDVREDGFTYNNVRLVPWGRSFNEIPLYSPAISFIWYGAPDCQFKTAEHVVVAAVPELNFTSPQVLFEEGKPFSLNLSGLHAGRHRIAVKAVAKADGHVAYEEPFDVNLRDFPSELQVTRGKRLNNLCVELANSPVKTNDTFEFVTDYDSWMFFTLKTVDGKRMNLSLDGKAFPETDPLTGLPEAFRFVEGGRHAVKAGADGTLVVRVIAELFSCGMNQGPSLPCFSPYDGEFAKKWALKAVTTLNRGSYVDNGAALVDAAHASGRIWMEDMYIAHKNITSERIMDILKQQLGRLGARDGNTSNELDYMTSITPKYTLALKGLKVQDNYDPNKLVYTWAGTFPPYIPEIHRDFIGTCLNASGGRGKILFEAYHLTKPTEKEAIVYMQNLLLKNLLGCEKIYPGYIRRAGIILGNFNQVGGITEEHHPQVDYKYYLDMQLNMLANHPAFEGLSCVGYWGTHHGDEEMYRWSHELLRHYVVEGRKDMLSTQYGFSYLPGHIVNNDFTDGLNGWTVEPAEEGSIAIASFKGYGVNNQNRWMSPAGCGDTFCTFKAVAGKPNRLSQEIKNLVPGKKYMLLFAVGDFDDLKAKRLNPEQLGFKATVSDADISPESFVFVDKREKGLYAHNNNVARQNLHRIIFTPKATKAILAFSDAAAKPGETLLFNYIQVKPFFEKER
ncbi:MAG: hypothetical protein J6X55_03245 [Victivallales bacterium]|nr:hypothetical protein [Victivallales bacterium]